LVAGYDLPVSLPSGADPSTLIRFMTRDKKAAGDLTMVLDGPSGVEPVHGIAPELAAEVLEDLRGDR